MDLRMEKEYMNLQMEIIMRDSFKMVNDKEEEHINGKMEINIMDIGNMIKWKVKVKCYLMKDNLHNHDFRMIL